MSSMVIKGVIRNGRVEVNEPIDLPDGTEVEVISRESAPDDDAAWDNSPEGIAAWLQWYDSLQPLILTDEERAAQEAAQQARKEWEKTHFDEHAEKLRRMWQ
jgi:hypothetical protein